MIDPTPNPSPPDYDTAWYGSIEYLLNISFIGALTCLILFLFLKLRLDHRRLPGPSAALSKLLAAWHAPILSIAGADAAQFLLIEAGTSVLLVVLSGLCLCLVLPVNLFGGDVAVADQFSTSTVSHIAKGSPLLWFHFLFVLVIAVLAHFGINAIEKRLEITRFRDGHGNPSDPAANSTAIFTVMVQGVPKTLGFDKSPLEEYIQHKYPGKVYKVIVPMDLCSLDDLATELVKVREDIIKLVGKIEARVGVFELDDGYGGGNHSGGVLYKLRLLWGRVVDLWDQIRTELGFTDEDKLRKLQELRADLEMEMAAYKEGRAKGAGVAFVVFKDVYTANKAVQDLRNERKRLTGKFFSLMELQLQRNQWKVERAPLATDIYWNHLGSSRLSLKIRRVLVNSCLLLMLLFCSSPLAVISAIMNAGRIIDAEAMDNAEVWLSWVQSSSWLATIIFQFLPNVLIFVSMYVIVPSALSYLSKFEKHLTVSGEQRAALLKMVCFFLVNLLLLRALVESSLESLLLKMGRCYLDGEDCKKIEQYMSASFLSKSCLSSLAFLITSTFLGISFDLLAPVPWIKNKLRKFRKNDMVHLVPEESENPGLENSGFDNQDIGNLRMPLIYEPVVDSNGFPPGSTSSDIDLPGQPLSDYPISRTSPVPKQTFDFAQYYAFNLTIFSLTIIYSAFAPLVVPVGAIYFGYRYLVDKYNFLFVYRVRGFPAGNDGRLMSGSWNWEKPYSPTPQKFTVAKPLKMEKPNPPKPKISRHVVDKEGVFYRRTRRVDGQLELGALREMFKHHIESFDYMVESGLQKMLEDIKPVYVYDHASNTKIKIMFEEGKLYKPLKEREIGAMKDSLYPFECRQAKISYCGKFQAKVKFQYGDGVGITEKFDFGQFPIMLKSKLCYLRDAEPQKLVEFHEEASEMGGYFILNGLERVIRLIILPKRNYPIGTVRSSFRDRQEGYSDTAVVIRCVREDQSAVTIKLYYLNNGSARLGIWIQGREYLLPVGIVLKALVDTTDHEIYVMLTCLYDEKYGRGKGCVGTQLFGERAKVILDEVRDLSLFTRMQCLQHIGEKLQSVMDGVENESYDVVGDAVLTNYILVHLRNYQDKFNLLIFMLQKLFSLVDQTSLPDNSDSLQNQEVLLPGHLITIYLKEKLQEWLEKGRRLLQDDINGNKKFEFSNAYMKKILDKNPPKQISAAIENMLKTGRLVTKSGLDLQQRAGMTVQAERLNFLRFLSHFRTVHRGASFAGLRTTSVRKLLPESWGFLCPVHTPDGEPCGLLNHMTCTSRITSYFDSQGNQRDFFGLRKCILSVMVGVGMTPALPRLVQSGPPEVLSVLLDGCVIGSIPTHMAPKAVSHLRRLKLSPTSGIPEDLEVGYVPVSMGGTYPGFYLFTSPSRFIRPVRNISVSSEKSGKEAVGNISVPAEEKDSEPEENNIELIGPFEQVYMEIKCADGGDGGRGHSSEATHEEIHPTGILSVVANLTPWSNHNQSPRNMYQCQMAKQTMGFSSQALHSRADQKLYHLQTPQTPIVSTKTYEKYCVDEFPSGTNAIVAVLAYSGYDMEDAMVLNKSSVDRGLCHGHIYQTETIDLAEKSSKINGQQKMFRRSYVDKSTHSVIDLDGLPYVGQKLKEGDPYYTIYDEETSKPRSVKIKSSEPGVVDYVAVDMKNKKCLQKASIRIRRTRNPIIGDKFSSRHGQKGVCSQLWPDIDMPFSGVTGMRPDLIINPHAFPSRMTIAMLLESIAAKGGSLSGNFVDATPFSSSVKNSKAESESEDRSLVDEIGSKLASYGFNYHGLEVLYSGVYGTELTCEIFIGPVYYQRLRHMVSDKFQVRSTGVVDPLTRQPLKGRKKGGGIRFGEMERDSLLAHGAAYLLNDRLHLSSDHHVADVCSTCGSILTTSLLQHQKQVVNEVGGLPPPRPPKKVICIACNSSKGMETVAMPYVFRYLAAELAAMNIKVTLDLQKEAGA